MSADRYPPSITVARLFERTSARGNKYLTGRWGNTRVTLMKTSETDNDGNPVWAMKLSEALPYKPQEAGKGGPQLSAKAARDARADWQGPSEAEPPNDRIPF